MKGVGKKMLIVLGIIIVAIIIYFMVPYSRLRNDFNSNLEKSIASTKENEKDSTYSIEDLPEAIQKFYKYTGLLNKVDSDHVNFEFKDADFLNMNMNKTLKINYSEHIFAYEPVRFAFIDSSLYGIPFQGLDSLINGKGNMKGVVAKNITLFDEGGEEMDKAALVTWLSEVIFMPAEMLSGDIEFVEIDKNSIEVAVKYKDLKVKGIYKFLDNGELVEFSTNDRAISKSNGSYEYRKWSANFYDYKDTEGLFLPNTLKSSWYFDNDVVTYFDGNNVKYTFFKGSVLN
ncbi:MAG: hypothetical protein GX275_09060 [Clostridiales bacterium]|nr:hypothetical protein [Clostridiales bacterium]